MLHVLYQLATPAKHKYYSHISLEFEFTFMLTTTFVKVKHDNKMLVEQKLTTLHTSESSEKYLV